MATKPFMSIIIPLYNGEKYLAPCIDSILNQGDMNYELILINDGSKDRTLKICQEYAEKDQRVKVLDQKNQGSAKARNHGLSIATGSWICFVDGDDILEEDALAFMHQSLDESCDIIYFDFKEFKEENPILQGDKSDQVQVFENERIQKLQWDCLCRYKANSSLLSSRLLTTPWAKIFRTEFIKKHQLKFAETTKREDDVLFNLTSLAYCQKAKYIAHTIYHYRLLLVSDSHGYKPQVLEQTVQALKLYHQIITEDYQARPDMMELYRYRILWELLYCVVLGPCNAMNPNTYQVKKQAFKQIKNSQPYLDVFQKCKTNKFSFQHNLIAKLTKYNQFFLLVLINRLNHYLAKLKYK